MLTLDDIRREGEASLQQLLASLDDRHKRKLLVAIQRYGRVQDIPESVWAEIRSDMESETAAILLLLMMQGDDWTAGQIELQGGRTTRLASPGMAQYALTAASRARALATSTVETLRGRLAREVEDAKLSPNGDVGEFTVEGLDEALEKALSPGRREGLAVDGTTQALSDGQRGAADRAGMRVSLIWITEGDERVCFPAGTMVLTESGQRPIESLAIGDRVMTREGLKPIRIASHRKYAGPLTTIMANGRAVTSTADHPFWTLEKQWVAAGKLDPSLTLYGINDEQIHILGCFNFSVSDSHHSPSAALEALGFTGISGGVAMPVHPVNFNGDALLGDGKVNRVSPNTKLLNGRYTKGRKSRADVRLGDRFSLGSSVARNGAKLPYLVRRHVSNGLAARLAHYYMRWSSAFFRAVGAIEMLLAPKRLSATFAGNVLSSARSATPNKAMRDACLNAELPAAMNAILDNEPDVLKAALARAALIATDLGAGRSEIELNAANRTRSVFANSLAFCRSKLELLKRQRHARFYHKNTVVYDIQVADCPEFFANGMLVHNCERCGPLHEQPEEVWSKVFPDGPGYTAHPRCRCHLRPIVEERKPVGESFREHMGPGDHPSGSSQDVHGHGGGSGKVLDWARKRFKDEAKAKAFAEWFGDSKVVDEHGEPLVVYHGVDAATMRIEDKQVVFTPSFTAFNTDGETEPGVWFTPDEKLAAQYGTPVPFFLKADNPVRNESPLSSKPSQHDGVYRMRGKGDGIHRAWEIAVFNANQIKLATGNRGTFDPKSPNINESEA